MAKKFARAKIAKSKRKLRATGAKHERVISKNKELLIQKSQGLKEYHKLLEQKSKRLSYDCTGAKVARSQKK